HAVMLDLSVALSEDQPLERAPAAQRWADNAEDLRGLLHECLEASGVAAKALGPSPDFYTMRSALSVCQGKFNKLVAGWIGELTKFEQVEDLVTLGRKHGPEWSAWTGVVRIGLESCHRPIEEAAMAMLTCWQELCDWVGGLSVTVNSSGVARQYNL